MNSTQCPVIALANQKGGVAKTTSAINLAQALVLLGEKVLVVDLDPQGNATQGLGVRIEDVQTSVSDLIRSRHFPIRDALYSIEGLDLIPATPELSRVELELVSLTNGQLRFAQRLRELLGSYTVVLLDTAPSFGPLMNSALNAASQLVLPVDSSYFALMGIRKLLAEVEEIRLGTNPGLSILGYLLTLADSTRMTQETKDGLIAAFGDHVFETRIRRSVRLREAPALGKTIFHHDPGGAGAEDYMALGKEVRNRLGRRTPGAHASPCLHLVESEVIHG